MNPVWVGLSNAASSWASNAMLIIGGGVIVTVALATYMIGRRAAAVASGENAVDWEDYVNGDLVGVYGAGYVPGYSEDEWDIDSEDME